MIIDQISIYITLWRNITIDFVTINSAVANHDAVYTAVGHNVAKNLNLKILLCNFIAISRKNHFYARIVLLRP